MNRRFALLSMVALAGCNSQPGPLTQTEYCNQYAQDVCAGVVPACLMTETDCTAARFAECTQVGQRNAGLNRKFIPANAEACLSKVSANYSKLNQGAVALDAADYQAMNQACSNVYRGTAIANDLCPNGADADCINDLVCDKGYCGTARLVAQAGLGCANIGEYCSQGLYCSNATGIYFCTSKVGLGGACGDSLPCMENLRCSAGICDVQLGIGEVCSVDQDCGSGFCEPYAALCAQDIRFARGTAACNFMSGT
jgi:hypothetical protein